MANSAGPATHQVKYGGIELPNPTGSYRYTRQNGARTFVFEQDFVVDVPSGDQSPAEFVQQFIATSDLMQANASLVVTWLDGQALLSLDPAAGTAARTRATIVDGGTEQFATSVKLTLRVDGDLPDGVFHGRGDGFIEGTVQEQLDPRNQPVYQFVLEYRFNSLADALSASEDATNGSDAWCRDWLDANATRGTEANYSLVDKGYSVDDQLAVLRATLQYRYELVPAKTDGDTTVAGHVIDELTMTPAMSTEWGAPNNEQTPYPIQVSATIRINSETTSDTQSYGYYSSTIAPLLEYEIERVLNGDTGAAGVVTTGGGADKSRFAILEESFALGLSGSTLQVQMTVQRVTSWLTWRYDRRWDIDPQIQDFEPADSRSHSYRSQSPGTRKMLTEAITGFWVSDSEGEAFESDEDVLAIVPDPPQYYKIRREQPAVGWRMARLIGGGRVRVYQINVQRESLYVLYEGRDSDSNNDRNLVTGEGEGSENAQQGAAVDDGS